MASDLELDVVVVDDGSTDRTAAVATAAGARVISLPFNLGVGGAVQTGYLVALQGGYDVAIQVDGDGQHPPVELPKLVQALRESEADLVIGSRLPPPARAPAPPPPPARPPPWSPARSPPPPPP